MTEKQGGAAALGKVYRATLVFKTVVYVVLVLLMLSYMIMALMADGGLSFRQLPLNWLILVPLMGLEAAVCIYLYRRASDGAPDNRRIAWLAGEAAVSWYTLFIYFLEPAHDIGLALFGIHGRFGQLLESRYLLDTATLPPILAIPPLAAGLLWRLTAKAGVK